MLGNLLATSAIIAGLIWLGRALQRAFFAPLAKLPGPVHSLVTDIWLMRKEFTSKRREYIHQLHEQYGPVVRLGPNEVSFTSLEALKEIYTSGGSGYDKTEFYTLFMQFGVRTMFSTLVKGDHSQKRRYIAGQYANTNIMRPQVMEGIQDRAEAFAKRCAESQGTSLDAYIWLHCFALDCASHHLFHPYGTHSIDDNEDFEMMEEQSYHDSLKENFAKYRWPNLSNLVDKLLQPRPSPIANNHVLRSNEKNDLGEQTLLYKLQHSKDKFEKIEMAAECMDHLAAGIDTTGDGLTFLLYQLSKPESSTVQDRLIEEIRTNEGEKSDDLAYMDAVIKEGLRCFPPIPMSQPRYVPPGGRTIDGYIIPAGTIVSCQAHSVHRLNENVFENGNDFIPERWLDSEKVVDMNRLFFAFGVGGRGCIGRHLAMAEMKCLLREVYSRFRTRVAPDMHGSMEMSDQIISSRPLDQTCKLIFEPLA
ncbi:related to benzoate 4-monooxygenase cytochrome P450 [Rhynchosporium secalis]|uniref:Related to benzoate 4-monooxygenase cytochrome P450 n=1 Tax=Rhynchosporium secalis TaxID=38038 RepID=A0A1E1LVE1_RHYSE|nr:related to benzoate 4-monooxygenase cytochrome P450 [Rhynchosporium secalis]